MWSFIRGIVRGRSCVAMAVLATLAGEGRASAGTLTEWPLPNITGGKVIVAPSPAGTPLAGDVFFIQKPPAPNATGLTQVGYINAGNAIQWQVPIGNADTVAVSPVDGKAYFGTRTQKVLGRIDANAVFFRWTLPAGFGDGPRSLAFDAGGNLFFASSSAVDGLWIVRFKPATAEVDAWQVPGSIGATGLDSTGMCVIDSTGLVYFTVSGAANQRIARLDPATGVFASWDLTPLAPSAGLSIGISDTVFFQEPGATNYMAQLFPATAVVKEWAFNGSFLSLEPMEAYGSQTAGFPASNALGSVLGVLDSTNGGTPRGVPYSTVGPVQPSIGAAFLDTPVISPASTPISPTSGPVTGTVSGAFTTWPTSLMNSVTRDQPWGAWVFGEQTDLIGELIP